MEERRFIELQRASISGKKAKYPCKPYTEEEFNEGYHYCLDWDGLFIGPQQGSEWDSCTCHPLKKKTK